MANKPAPTDGHAPSEPAGDGAPAVPPETPPAPPKPEPPPRHVQLRRAIIQAKLAILALPLTERQRFVDEDAELRRLERIDEQARLDGEKAEEEAREAEAARQRALDEAEAARTMRERDLANLRAAAEAVRRDQAELRQRLVAARQAFDSRHSGDEKKELPLIAALDDVAPRSVEASRLFADVTEAVDAARAELRGALAAAGARLDVPRLSVVIPQVPDDDEQNRHTVDELIEMRARLDLSADELVAMDSLLKRDAVHAAFSHEERLTAASIRLLDLLPLEERREVLGFSARGLAQLQRELSHVPLAIRWYWMERQQTVPRFLASLSQPLEALMVGAALLWFLVTVALAIYLARRRLRLLKRLRRVALRRATTPAGIRTRRVLIDGVTEISGPLIFVAAVLVGWRALWRFHEIDELAVMGSLVWYYAVYRLAITAGHGLISWSSRSSALVFAHRYSEKVLRSLRLVGATALAVVALLKISGHVLGYGYLYRLVLGFSWVCVFPIAITLLGWWRGDIVETYLHYRPSGSLARAVERTRTRWYGFFVAVAAVTYLGVHAFIRLAQGFLLGFEQSRKALAFLFRRRLERRAEAQAAEIEVELPPELVRALTDEPAARGDVIDLYPGMEQFDADLAGWRASARHGSLLVVAEPGYGKTEWLRAACARAPGLPVHWVTLDGHCLEPAALIGQIAAALEAPPCGDAATLARWLQGQSARRVVTIDNTELLILRGVDSLRAWDELRRLLTLARDRVFWLGAMDQDPYHFLQWSRGEDECFRRVVERPHWSEEEIAELLQHRTRSAGYEPVYHDLVVGRVEGVSGDTQLVSTGREYARLLWDYADGCPRLALHCWRQSLQPDASAPAGEGEAKTVRVRLFRRPDTSCLEELSERNRFLLASVVWHANLALDEAAESLRFPRASCEEGLELLRELGVLRLVGDRYHVATPWLRHVNRYLRRKHLIRD
ncbi:MAG: ATP-binding protein [Myxococcales bacterium]|nr:ATP-binding protein [Myxococcales bacterium]